MLNDEERALLIEAAMAARRWAYAPYSNYQVGAALLTTEGKTYDGVNIENAAYPATICAERVAVFKAISQGEREFKAIAVVTRNGGFPCGSCRQVLAEFGTGITVLVANEDGRLLHEVTVAELLPHSFGPSFLG